MLQKLRNHKLLFVIVCLLSLSVACSSEPQTFDDTADENGAFQETPTDTDPTNPDALGSEPLQGSDPSLESPAADNPVESPTAEGPADPTTAIVPEATFPEISSANVIVRQNDEMTVYTLPADMLFETDGITIRPDAETLLQEVSASLVQRFPDTPLLINSHTATEAGAAVSLAEQQATAVQEWLTTEAGLSNNLMATKGYSDAQIAPDANADNLSNPTGQQPNNRIEIVVLTPQ